MDEDSRKKGQAHNDSNVRTIKLPPFNNNSSWKIDQYKNRLSIIEDLLVT
jgi:hypothetical protein